MKRRGSAKAPRISRASDPEHAGEGDATAVEGGGAIFFVSNDRSGTLIIEDPLLEVNPSAGFETQGYPGIFVLANGDPQVVNSIVR